MSDFDQRRWDGAHRASRSAGVLEEIRRSTLTDALPDGVQATTIWPSWPLERLGDELRLSDGGVLLDVACGVGDLGRWIARRAGATVLGVEPSPVGRAAAEAAADEGDRYVEGLFGSLPVDDASVDAALVIDAMQFAPDAVAAVRDIARCVKPGGRIVVVAPMRTPDAGLEVVAQEETPDWRARTERFHALLAERREEIRGELGDATVEQLAGIPKAYEEPRAWHGLTVLQRA